MKHAATRMLYDYWSRLRGRRTAPARYEIEPGDIRHILGDTFILEAQDRGTYGFRLAGTRLCAAYCRELKGRNFLDMWTGKDREAIACMLAAIVEDGAAAVVGLEAHNERGQKMPVEIMLLPLRHDGPRHTRILGCYAPLDQPYWLGLHPVVRQPVLSLRLIWPDERPSFLRTGAEADLAPAAEPPVLRRSMRASSRMPGRKVAHLTVIDGGRK
ncbi:PAS domain-containing protein [Mongoliimonas terrestris]|uniref:PAS domain-containing protein n=1 Tax=Mongoliimonas terrestris TaxID=1709001 RepID=UPI0009495A34|nr:PAS domain-containing protein [Mongoliimonas terrestris]